MNKDICRDVFSSCQVVWLVGEYNTVQLSWVLGWLVGQIWSKSCGKLSTKVSQCWLMSTEVTNFYTSILVLWPTGNRWPPFCDVMRNGYLLVCGGKLWDRQTPLWTGACWWFDAMCLTHQFRILLSSVCLSQLSFSFVLSWQQKQRFLWTLSIHIISIWTSAKIRQLW